MSNSATTSSSIPAVLGVVSASAAAGMLYMRGSGIAKKFRDSATSSTSPMSEIYVPNKDADIKETAQAIQANFPGAMTNGDFVAYLEDKLGAEYGYGPTTLVATALCCDEVNRPLVDALEKQFNKTFSMGGLAGFAFGGVTSFGAMAHHIPDGGSCLVVYGPHVGVDSNGHIGTVERRGRKAGGACCGSAKAAAGYVHEKCQCKDKHNDGEESEDEDELMDDPLDAQQQFVNKLLLPHGKRLEDATNKNVELPKALFDAQHELMQRITSKGCSNVGGNGKIALMGGIQINTPDGMQDYFLPLSFELRNNRGALVEDFITHQKACVPTIEAISNYFPKALPNDALVARVQAKLEQHGYCKSSTLLATSLCCDEVNKPLMDIFTSAYGNNFNMGGLAGFAFGGVTSFGAMAHHIPDGGSCLVVYGPHVGIDSQGNVGTVERVGRAHGGACCGSAAAACAHALTCHANHTDKNATVSVSDPLDAQQSFVNHMLLPHAERLASAPNQAVELPLALYEAQKELMDKIVGKGCGNVAGNGTIALLGGIQINTPVGGPGDKNNGMHDYFLPLSFELRSNRGEVIANLLWD